MDLKIQNDFFIGKSNNNINDKPKKEKKETVENINYDLITEDNEDAEDLNTNKKLSASNYFDDGNAAANYLVSELIVTKIKNRECDHLFYNKNNIKDKIEIDRLNEEEGYSINHFKTDDDIIMKENIFNPMECADKACEIAVKNVKPLQFKHNLQKGVTPNLNNLERVASIENNIFEICIDSIKLNNHPLYSIEHVLEIYLIKAYKMSKSNGSDIYNTNTLLVSLRERKKCIRSQALEFYDNNEKKIFKSEDYQKIIRSIKNTRILRLEYMLKGKELQASIIALWKCIKYVRKKDGYSNTGIHLEIQRSDFDKNDDQNNWEINFECELADIIDEIKCEYFEKRIKYNQQMLRMKKTQKQPKEKLIKPSLNYDENELRNNLQKELIRSMRIPGDPLIIFEIKNLPITVTQTVTSPLESKRRRDVNKLKYFIKILINNKDVCKTKAYSLDQDFSVNVNEKYVIHLHEKLIDIKLILIEKYNVIQSNIFESIVPTPNDQTTSSNAVFQAHNIMMDNIKGFNDSVVGCGRKLNDLVTKYYPDMNIHGMDEYLQEKLITECKINIKTYFANEESIQNNIKNSISSDDYDFETVINLLDNVYDPNDPKNSLLVMYLNNIATENIDNRGFHLNSNLFMSFQENFNDIRTAPDKKNISTIREKIKTPDNQNKSENYADIINEIDAQRHNSIQKLQTMNSFLFQRTKEDVDKNVNNIITNIKYPTIRSITVDFLNPKKPLFYQSTQNSSVQQSQQNTHKDYLLKMCIFKAFHLPSRLDNDGQSIYNSNEEGIIKMVSLRPFVQINCQGQTKRTTTAVGSSPTWNEQLAFPLRFNPASVITFQLFDEVIENLLIDDRLEESTVHYHYNIRWLASLKIPLLNIFSQSKVEGTFLMHCPLELLGYKHNLEEKHPTSRMSYDSLRKELPIKQREEIFISVFLEIIPNLNDISTPIDDRLNSNEVELTHQHLTSFRENFQNQFPSRQLQVLVTDSCGKSVCVTRYFQPIALPDFNECLKKLFFNSATVDASVSSKSTTPRKKSIKATFEKEDIDPNTIQSILSTNVIDRRHSRSIKETFEMKSLNESVIDDIEIPLLIKMHICTRYVAMIPTYKIQSLHNQFIVLSAQQTLRLTCGSMFDHTILLMAYFLQLGIECWCISGYGLPRGFSTYVLVRENISTNELSLKGTDAGKPRQMFKMKDMWKYIIYDATSGIKFDTKDSFCPLQRVHFVCNNENIWSNIQSEDRCNLIRFNLSNGSDWRPVFQKGGIVSCPGPLSVNTDNPLYEYEGINIKQFRDVLEEKIKTKVQKWRGHRKTVWNRNCSKILKDSIIYWEKWCLNTSSLKPRCSSQLQQLQLSYQIYGFPLNLPYTTIGDIMSAVKGTQIYLNEHSGVEFALGVEVFSYPNLVYSIWIYLASITKK